MTKKTFKGLTSDNTSAVAEGHLTHLRLRLAHTLRTLREKEGLTQAQLAERLGVKQAAISKLESPYKAHDLETILRVLASLNVEFVAAIRDQDGLRPLTPLRDEMLVTLPTQLADEAAQHGLSLEEYVGRATEGYSNYNLKVPRTLQSGWLAGSLDKDIYMGHPIMHSVLHSSYAGAKLVMGA